MTLPNNNNNLAAASPAPKPDWLKVRAPSGPAYSNIKQNLRELKLFTVCEEARCPNLGECWSGGTATIMLLGDTCTRGCRFCAVKTGRLNGVVDKDEPEKVGSIIAQSDLEYVVLTSVNRDDLPDGGADHFARTVENIKQRAPHILCEALVPDFQGNLDSVERVLTSNLEVYAHNIETVRRLTPKVRDRRATYDQSLKTLLFAKQKSHELTAKKLRSQPVYTKTSIQLGHGETPEEVEQALVDLRQNQVDIVTFGQYLQPTKKHLKVEAFISPIDFKIWEEKALKMGFVYVASGPLVRSSYKAGEFFMTNLLKNERKNHGF